MNFFEKLKKKKEMKKAKIKYFKKHDKKLTFVSTLNKSHPKLVNALKISFLGVLPLSLIGIGTYLGVKDMKDNETLFDEIVELDKEGVTRRVYLLSNENDTVPISINIESMNSIHEEILTLFNLLKMDSSVTSSSFKGVIPSETRLVSFTLENGKLSLNLTSDLLNYEGVVSKEKMLDSLTYTMIQFDEIDEVELYIEDELFVASLNGDKGINLDKTYSLNSLANKKLMTYFYEKEIDNKSYYLPKSIYVDIKEKDNLTFYEGSKYIPAAASKCKRLDIYKGLSFNQDPYDEFIFNVNELALIDENLVNQDLYNMVMLSLDLMGLEKKVSFLLEGEEVQVSGIVDEESFSVSSIVYNEYQI